MDRARRGLVLAILVVCSPALSRFRCFCWPGFLPVPRSPLTHPASNLQNTYKPAVRSRQGGKGKRKAVTGIEVLIPGSYLDALASAERRKEAPKGTGGQ